MQVVADAFERRRTRGPEWPQHVLFVAGLPKSGTTWVVHLLEEVPRYKRRFHADPDGCAVRHDVCDEIFDSLPADLYTVLKLHTRPSARNLDVIERHVQKTLVTFRDLRDQCVSRYHHVLSDPLHPRHEDYSAWGRDRALDDCVEVTIEHYVPWVQGWVEAIRSDPVRYRGITYEALRTRPSETLAEILGFFEIELSAAEIESIEARVGGRTRFELRARDMAASRSTARSGRIGDWRHELAPHHVGRLEETAGDVQAALGYSVAAAVAGPASLGTSS